MSAVPAPAIPSWRGDPAVLVYAVRYALGRRNSHAPQAVLIALTANVRVLPQNTRRVIVRDITTWLDGPGAAAGRLAQEPWVMALAALGVRRKAVRAETRA